MTGWRSDCQVSQVSPFLTVLNVGLDGTDGVARVLVVLLHAGTRLCMVGDAGA